MDKLIFGMQPSDIEVQMLTAGSQVKGPRHKGGSDSIWYINIQVN